MPSGQSGFYRTFLRITIPFWLLFIAYACATIVSPTGGPKDETPPKILGSTPANYSTNFKDKSLKIDFNEFVTLKNPEKFLLISPPMGEEPDLKIKGKSLVIKIKDTLRNNTTYNFYLGDAIVDITEGNPVTNFNFAFSTGPEIDSLSLSGVVSDAFTRLPAKGAMVMLYSDFADSIPMKQLPRYVSRTSENGSFRLNSLASGKYRVIALLDGNSDYMYNLPTELIGFSGDSVEPYYNPRKAIDTLEISKSETENRNRISIEIFAEPDSTQRILKSTMAAKNRMNIAFRYPVKQASFRALNVADSLPWSVLEWNRTNDTLNAWLLNQPDTLKLEIRDQNIVIDTVSLSTTLKTTGKNKNTEKSTKLRYTHNLYKGLLGYGSQLLLTFANPVSGFNPDSLKLTVMTDKDTTRIIPVARFTDSIQRHLMVKYDWKTTDSYDLCIPELSFTDIYSDTCDSTHIAFQIMPVEEYGKFAVTVNRKILTEAIIVQLLTEKGLVVDQRIVMPGVRADFGIIPPGSYGLKAIIDANGNGRWDTGRFVMKIQPEQTVVHPKIFEVPANWELEETWDL